MFPPTIPIVMAVSGFLLNRYLHFRVLQMVLAVLPIEFAITCIVYAYTGSLDLWWISHANVYIVLPWILGSIVSKLLLRKHHGGDFERR